MLESEPGPAKSNFRRIFWIGLVGILALALVLLALPGDVRWKLVALTFFSVLVLTSLFILQQREKTRWLGSQEQLEKLKHYLKKSQELNQLILARAGFLQIALKLGEYFKEVLKASKLVVLYRKNKVLQAVLSYGDSFWSISRKYLKVTDPLILHLRSFDGLDSQVLDLSEFGSEWVRKFLPGFQKGKVVPYELKGRIEGICIFLPESLNSALEKEFPVWGWENLKLALEFQKLAGLHKEQTRKLKKRLLDLENQPASREFKKKLGDLESVMTSAQNIFTALEEDRLLTSFLNLVQQQTSCKFGLLYVLDEKRENWIIKQSLGLELRDTKYLAFPVASKLPVLLKTKTKPQNLVSLDQDFKRELPLKNLLESGIHVGARLSSQGQVWGLVFLGEKSNNHPYQEQELELVSILCQMLSSAKENLKQFKKIEELSYTDSLTGLYNYRYFYKRLTEEYLRAKRFNRSLALVMFDIDSFKIYNDTHGHQAGDRVLRQLGNLLLNAIRSIDIASRYGGEEFCIIMPEADSSECLKFMERLRKVISHHPFKDEYLAFDHHITISVGGAIYPTDARNVDRLIYCADMALLRAKNAGKNKAFLFYEPELTGKK